MPPRRGSYWYQIGTVSGPRSGPADADKAAICGSAKSSSRSRTDNLLSAMAQSLGTATASSPVGPAGRPQLGLFDNPVRVFSLDELAATVRKLERERPGRTAEELSGAVFTELAIKRT